MRMLLELQLGCPHLTLGTLGFVLQKLNLASNCEHVEAFVLGSHERKLKKQHGD